MPRIRYIFVRCTHCNAGYKIRLERIEQGSSFECLTCGMAVSLEGFGELLKVIYRYSEIIVDLEAYGKMEGDVLILKAAAESYPG